MRNHGGCISVAVCRTIQWNLLASAFLNVASTQGRAEGVRRKHMWKGRHCVNKLELHVMKPAAYARTAAISRNYKPKGAWRFLLSPANSNALRVPQLDTVNGLRTKENEGETTISDTSDMFTNEGIDWSHPHPRFYPH